MDAWLVNSARAMKDKIMKPEAGATREVWVIRAERSFTVKKEEKMAHKEAFRGPFSLFTINEQCFCVGF